MNVQKRNITTNIGDGNRLEESNFAKNINLYTIIFKNKHF